MAEKEITKNKKPIPCKMILVGDSGVGKTSMINRYLNEYSKNVTPTISTSFFNKIEIINNYKMKFQIWDTVGQEQYRSLNSLFFKDAHICLMVYDITKESSFKSIKEYWYQAVINNGLEGVIFGIAGNKNDLYMNEKVDQNEVKSFCKQINAIFQYTSAKENICIDELFKELGDKFVNSNFMLEVGSEYFQSRNDSFIINNEDNKKRKGCCYSLERMTFIE